MIAQGLAYQQQTISIDGSGGSVDFNIDAGRIIAGTVRDAFGNPIPFAQVGIVDQETGEIHRAVADINGNYRNDSLPSGTFDVIVADRTHSVVVSGVVPGYEPTRVDASLAPGGGRLSGVVRDASGDPIVNAPVRIVGPGDVTLAAGVTDANGFYLIDNVSAGDVFLVVAPNCFLSTRGTVSVADGAAVNRDFALGEVIAVTRPDAVEESGAAGFFALSLIPVESTEPAGRVQGRDGDFLTGIQPPSRFAADTAEFRDGFSAPDDDCPEVQNAYADALRSRDLVNQAFDGFESQFESINNINKL